MFGIQVYTGVTFMKLLEPNEDIGWHAKIYPEDHESSHFSFDVIIGATGGEECVLEGFPRYSQQERQEVLVTCNFVNTATKEEGFVNEISGLSKKYHEQFFLDLEREKRIKLENIIYYKDLTHYFALQTSVDALVEADILKENIWFDLTLNLK